MDKDTIVTLAILAVVVPLVVVVVVAIRRAQVAARQGLAESLGLAYSRNPEGAARGKVLGAIRVHGSDRLTGTWRGRSVRVDFATRSSGGHGHHEYTRTVVEGAAPAGVTFVMRRESLGSRLGESLGLVKDLHLGDEELDHAWRAEGSPEEAVRRLLVRPAVKSALGREPRPMAVLARDGRLELLMRSTLTDPEKLRGLLDLSADLADAVA